MHTHFSFPALILSPDVFMHLIKPCTGRKLSCCLRNSIHSVVLAWSELFPRSNISDFGSPSSSYVYIVGWMKKERVRHSCSTNSEAELCITNNKTLQVGIAWSILATGWTARVQLTAGARNFSLLNIVHTGCSPPSLLSNGYRGLFPQG
jgi:hypothetical protein